MSKYLLILFFVPSTLLGQYFDEDPDSNLDDESYESHDTGESESAPEMEAPQPSLSQPTIIYADESEGPDSGNWFEKLKWWKEAKWLYTIDIAASMAQLETISKGYEEKGKGILEGLEAYSSGLPFKRQTAVAFIDDLIANLQKRNEELAQQQTKKQARGMPKESADLEENQKLLNQLKDNIKDFNTLTQRLTQTFDQVVSQQMEEARNYDKKALSAYESIEKTLDDKIAQQRYNEVQNCQENILAVTDYLEGPLMQFVDKAWDKAQQLMPTIKNSIDELQKRGIIVRQPSAEESEQAKLLAQKKAQEKKAAEEYAALPWWMKIFVSISSFFSTIWSSISGFFSWMGSFFSSAPSPEKKVPKPTVPSPAKQIAQPVAQ
jgi:hypothetical protein